MELLQKKYKLNGLVYLTYTAIENHRNINSHLLKKKLQYRIKSIPTNGVPSEKDIYKQASNYTVICILFVKNNWEKISKYYIEPLIHFAYLVLSSYI